MRYYIVSDPKTKEAKYLYHGTDLDTAVATAKQAGAPVDYEDVSADGVVHETGGVPAKLFFAADRRNNK
jgi:hypothetical protein